jgi:hypothetical protein
MKREYAQGWAEMRGLRAERFLQHTRYCLLALLGLTLLCGFIGSL